MNIILHINFAAMGIKNVILIVVLNRFQQITTLHWFSAPNEDLKVSYSKNV